MRHPTRRRLVVRPWILRSWNDLARGTVRPVSPVQVREIVRDTEVQVESESKRRAG